MTSSTDAGGLVTVNEYDPRYSILIAVRIGPGLPGAGTLLWKAGTYNASGQALTQTLAQGLALSTTFTPISKLPSSSKAVEPDGTIRQDKRYRWDPTGNLLDRKDLLQNHTETFDYDDSNRLVGTLVTAGTQDFDGTVPANISYSPTGNLLSKPGATMLYADPTKPHAVSSATVKGAQRTYSYTEGGGYVSNDGKRSYEWTSFGQLKTLTYESAPALQNLAGIQIFAPAKVVSEFDFDAGGNRMRQTQTRTEAGGNSIIEKTLYLGSYEREERFTKTSPSATEDPTRTLHRHSIGGFAVYTRITDVPGVAGTETRLSVILKDHLGSTDLIRTAIWGTSGWSVLEPEKQSFDAWGERRNPETLARFRSTHTDPFRTSAQDYDRGYTGHEQLDDSGLIHMNGRIYDPEVGRMLSPDPFVQVPENSQNFNRYSYVLNNPMNLTDPSGFSWVSKAWDKVGDWFSENWRTVVAIVVVVVLAFVLTPIAGVGWNALGQVGISSGWAQGAIVGAAAGASNTAINGGNSSDILRAAVVGGIQGGITGGLLNGWESTGWNWETLRHVVGHGVVGGSANVAMGGKFQDGFLSAAASAAAADFGMLGNPDTPGFSAMVSRTIRAGIVGGTASALGGGKFANGAWTASFQHLLNAELVKPEEVKLEFDTKIVDADSQLLLGIRLSHGNDSRYFAVNGEHGILMPRSVDLAANFSLSQAQNNKNSNPKETANWFRSQVKNKGPWDYKQIKSGYQNFGNFHFGFVGFAAGISEGVLLRQAGRAQIAAGTSRPEWGTPSGGPYGLLGGSGTFGDDPVDQYYIRQGYKSGFIYRNTTLPFR